METSTEYKTVTAAAFAKLEVLSFHNENRQFMQSRKSPNILVILKDIDLPRQEDKDGNIKEDRHKD